MTAHGRRTRAGALALVLTAMVAACGPTEDEVVLQEAQRSQQPERVDRDELEDGVALQVRGGSGLVVAAEAFVAVDGELDVSAEMLAELDGEIADDGSALVVAGNGRDADLLVVYRNAPFCGLLPVVEVLDPADGVVRILVGNEIWATAIEEADVDEVCEDLSFTEAVALRFVGDDDPTLLDIQVPGYELVVP